MNQCDYIDKITKLEKELKEYKDTKTMGCNYIIHIPANDGCPDIERFYHECSECGTDYIDIEDSNEWNNCPWCGKTIKSKETYECENCLYACSEDGDGYCENNDGKHYRDCINDMCFDGCKEYQNRIEKECAQ